MTVLHLMTQRDQPYGSVRQCCERCGKMLGHVPSEPWTSQPHVYADPPPPFRRCDDEETGGA